MSYENQFQKKKKVPKHLPNYYDAISFIAKDLGEFTFYMEQNGKTAPLRFDEFSFYRKGKITPETRESTIEYLKPYWNIIKTGLAKYLKEKNLFDKYVPLLRLAELADLASEEGLHIRFIFKDRLFTGYFEIVGQGDGARYYYKKKNLDLKKAIELMRRFELDVLLQMSKATQNARYRKQKDNGELAEKESQVVKDKLGIKTVEKGGKILIDAGNILSKGKGNAQINQAQRDKIAENAAKARMKIFGKQ